MINEFNNNLIILMLKQKFVSKNADKIVDNDDFEIYFIKQQRKLLHINLLDYAIIFKFITIESKLIISSILEF